MEDKNFKIWQECKLPVEILSIRSLFYSPKFLISCQLIYLLACITMGFGFIFLFIHNISHHPKTSSILFFIFYFGYALFYISLPPFIYSFLSQIFCSNDLLPLFYELLSTSSSPSTSTSGTNSYQYNNKQYFSFQWKASFLSKFNYLSTISVSIAYCLNNPFVGNSYWVAIIFCFLFIIPTTTMFILACYTLELYRIQESNYLSDIMILRDNLYQYRYQALYLRTKSNQFQSIESKDLPPPPPSSSSSFPNMEMDFQPSLQTVLLEDNRLNSIEKRHPPPSSPSPLSFPSSNFNPSTIKFTIFSLLERYIQLQVYSHSISLKYGHVFLLCLINSMTLIISSIWSLYRKEYSIGSSLGYVLVGLIFFHEIAYLIVDINEKYYLICRELSNCILTIQSFTSSSSTTTATSALLVLSRDQTHSNPIQNLTENRISMTESLGIQMTSEDINNLNLFLTCLEYSKIQIFLFGNFVLRFRTLLGVISSVLAAFIPGVVT